MKVAKICFVFSFVLFVVYAQTVRISADDVRFAPRLLNYQGYLTDSLGIPITGDREMRFAIFDTETGGNELWSETDYHVILEKGVFSVILGSFNTIPDSVFAGFANTWLELTLEGTQVLTPRTRITSAGYAYTATYADTAEFSRIGAADNDWTINGNILHPSGGYGLVMRSGNITYGIHDSTHVNFGIACTTGISGQNRQFCTVSGGRGNAAKMDYTTVGGGYSNIASAASATIGGGYDNTASNGYATIAGGYENTASNIIATVGGGQLNTASGYGSVVGGGYENAAASNYSLVSGGVQNYATNYYSAVCGGYADTVIGRYGGILSGFSNLAGDTYDDTAAVIGGGWENEVTEKYATISGGYNNASSAAYSTIGGGVHNTARTDYATVGGGEYNDANGFYATIGGGQWNTVTGWKATIGGGYVNTASSVCATVAGGASNVADSVYTFIGGGMSNSVSGNYATIAGGTYNTATYDYTTISGGEHNNVGGYHATVGGGRYNNASGYRSTIGGGEYNFAGWTGATVAGGSNNSADSMYCFIGGGYQNHVAGNYSAILAGYADTITMGTSYSVLIGVVSKCTQDSTVMIDMPHIRFGDEVTGYEFPTQRGTNGQMLVTDGSGTISWSDSPSSGNWIESGSVLYTNDYWGIARGGAYNMLYGDSTRTHINFGVRCTTGVNGQNKYCCTVSGGRNNVARGDYSTIAGGWDNTTDSTYSFVGGGWHNTAVGWYATVTGGSSNEVCGERATICGGGGNTADSTGATVGGGQHNDVLRTYGTISGGQSNTVAGSYATVAGGYDNSADSAYSAIGGGFQNQTSRSYATVSGGRNNTASGLYATVPGGYNNTASGNMSFAGGNKAIAQHKGCFVWADSSSGATYESTGNNQFKVRAIGGIEFRGNVAICNSSGDTVVELGTGLDYAEGFNVAGEDKISPGCVLSIDVDNPGKLSLCYTSYDTKVAGIAAGANDLGSGVQLGGGQYACNVALAGRVFCNVDASAEGIEPGDLLTTSSTPGYAMKVTDYNRAQGAILGKAMEKLEKGKKGQILVLVTLQ